MKKVMIFGSTGSIGRNALKVLEGARDAFTVTGLCAHSDIGTLLGQVRQFRPSYVCVADRKKAKILASQLPKKVKLFKGEKGLKEFSQLSSDISLMAISGISALIPLLANIRHTKRVALANKESIVTAGSFVFKEAERYGTEIIPVDSEINALFQLFEANGYSRHKQDCFRKVYLTASGGSLFDCRRHELFKIRIKDVLAHPTWKMGQRITVDSATLVNKGFEAIETHNFFNIAYEKIDIVIHRESTIHALAEFADKTIMACLYPADMKIPIAFAFHYPRRVARGEGINFGRKFSFSFQPIRYADFPLLKIILSAAKRGDNALVILNACDETAIKHFLKKKIKFTDIYRAFDYVFGHYPSKKIEDVADVFHWDSWGRLRTEEYLKKVC